MPMSDSVLLFLWSTEFKTMWAGTKVPDEADLPKELEKGRYLVVLFCASLGFVLTALPVEKPA